MSGTLAKKYALIRRESDGAHFNFRSASWEPLDPARYGEFVFSATLVRVEERVGGTTAEDAETGGPAYGRTKYPRAAGHRHRGRCGPKCFAGALA